MFFGVACFKYPQGQGLNAFPGQPLLMLYNSGQEIFPLNLHWHNLRTFPVVLLLVTWEKRPTPTTVTHNPVLLFTPCFCTNLGCLALEITQFLAGHLCEASSPFKTTEYQDEAHSQAKEHKSMALFHHL